MNKCKHGADHIETFCRDPFCGFQEVLAAQYAPGILKAIEMLRSEDARASGDVFRIDKTQFGFQWAEWLRAEAVKNGWIKE